MFMKGSTGNEAYAYADKHFREACKVILGGEVGALKECEEWLLALKQPMGSAKSSLSGAPLTLVSPDFPQAARYLSMDEAFAAKPAPFSVNDIKDIDSLFRAAFERFAYSGNLVFGNSQFVEGSSDVSDSFYVYKSARVLGCKAIACSTIIKDSNYLFGCNVASKDEYCMRSHQFTFDARCFEVNLSTSSSDCYYTYDCVGCKDAMFSFGQRNAASMIGNLALPKEKYLPLKAALLEQMRSELKAKKKLPSLSDIFTEAARGPAVLPSEAKACAKKFERKISRAPVQKAWDATCRLVLGQEMGDITRFKEWLLRHNYRIRKVQSVLGSGEIPAASYENLKALPDSRYVNIDERAPLTRLLKFTEKEAGAFTLANAGKTLSRIAYITSQFHEGTILNVYGCPLVMWSSDCEEVHGCIFMKRSAYSTWGRDSEHLFGSAFVLDSGFNIKCYNSFKLKGCFEVDSARSSAGCYYCHNVENCHDSIFCSNVKNLRYAVCNKEVGKEEFARVKAMLLARVVGELKEKGGCAADVYSIGEK
ncbi:MAG: hypothetical protein NTX79_03215 [Candidatus Micrarchaeota archaeon]|nr:hypothetical protein [Candidatus Micrarchaeota archaeon]